MNGLYRLFQQYVSNIASASAPIDAFREFLKAVLGTILFLSHWLLSHITIVETMDSSDRKFESCRNDLSTVLGKNVGRARDRTSNLLFYKVNKGAWLGKWL